MFYFEEAEKYLFYPLDSYILFNSSIYILSIYFQFIVPPPEFLKVDNVMISSGTFSHNWRSK